MTDPSGRGAEPADHEQSVSRHAPVYTVPRRSFSAVEHPMLVQDIDKGIATFGRKFNFQEARGIGLKGSRAFNANAAHRCCIWRIPVRPSRCIYAQTTLQ